MNVPTGDAIFILVRAFVLSLLPLDAKHVIQGQGNLTSMPKGPCVVITPAGQKRLSTNVPANIPLNSTRAVKMSTEYKLQVDCYGPDSSDYATTLTAMWRDPYGCDALAPNAAPLISTDPIQMPLINGEQNYEQRWTFTVMLQFNPVVSVQQQYAEALKANLINVDVVYPPV